MSEYRNIWVFIETFNGAAKSVGLELLNPGRMMADKIGQSLVAVVIGSGVDAAVKAAAEHGADQVIVVEDEAYRDYNTETFSDAMYQLIQKYRPDTILFGASSTGRDFAPRVSCRVGTGLTADCTALDIDVETGNVGWTRPAFGGNLMVEYLDDFLTVDHLLHKAVQVRQVLLLLYKVDADPSHGSAYHFHYQPHGQHSQERQRDADIKHTDKHSRDGENGGDELRHGLGDQLAQGVCVIGVEAHGFAMGVGIEIPDGQPLHFGKHLITDLFQNALGNGDCHTVINQGGYGTRQINTGNGDQGVDQAGKYRRIHGQQGGDIIINQCLQEHGGCGACDGTEQNADDNDHQASFICTHIAHDPPQGLGVKPLGTHAFLHSFRGHGRPFLRLSHCHGLLSAEIDRLRGKCRRS